MMKWKIQPNKNKNKKQQQKMTLRFLLRGLSCQFQKGLHLCVCVLCCVSLWGLYTKNCSDLSLRVVCVRLSVCNCSWWRSAD